MVSSYFRPPSQWTIRQPLSSTKHYAWVRLGEHLTALFNSALSISPRATRFSNISIAADFGSRAVSLLVVFFSSPQQQELSCLDDPHSMVSSVRSL
jgi:hypothetical protein